MSTSTIGETLNTIAAANCLFIKLRKLFATEEYHALKIKLLFPS